MTKLVDVVIEPGDERAVRLGLELFKKQLEKLENANRATKHPKAAAAAATERDYVGTEYMGKLVTSTGVVQLSVRDREIGEQSLALYAAKLGSAAVALKALEEEAMAEELTDAASAVRDRIQMRWQDQTALALT